MKTDQRIVVISGASTGIGFCAARHLGELGNFVFAGARTDSDISKLTAIPNVQGVMLDITHPEDIHSLVSLVETSFGHLDVLINNAGIPGWGAIMDRDIEYFRRVMDVNLFGTLRMIQAFYTLIKRSKKNPVIVNVSSQGGHYAFPFWAPYHMSKWALEALSDSLRRELLPLGIRVVVIQPGAIISSAFEKQRSEFEEYESKVDSEFHPRAVALLRAAFERPAKKAKDPQLVSDAIVHAIYSKNSRLYYQPGRRLLPDVLAAKLPPKWVDRYFLR